MEQESGCPPPGPSGYISLNENEQRFYSGLHSRCQTDAGSGKLSAAKVVELLKASQLPPDSLHQVTEVCGARRSVFFGSAQFLVALKLVAAAQSRLPISLESTHKDLPLPRFPGLQSDQDPRYAAGPQPDPRYTAGPPGLGPQPDPRYAAGPPGLGPQQDPRYAAGAQVVGASVPWIPAERSTARLAESSAELGESWSPTHSPLCSPPHSPPLLRHYPVTMATPGTIPHTANERPVIQQDPTPKHWPKPPEHSAVPRASIEQQRVCSEEGDPWRITEEQREYYTNQFKSLQPDLGALILGTVAKNFFTKSKLPIPELSHIWELSDVDRDGALTFSEFCTAFHLIVARKNGCSLPESLPPSLQPSLPPPLPSNLALPPSLPSSLPPSLPPSLQTGFVDQDLDSPDTPGSAEPLIVFEDVELSSKQMDRSGLDRVKPSLLKQEMTSDSDNRSRTWRTTQDKHILPARTEPPVLLEPHMKTRSRPRSYSSTSIDEAMKKAEEPPTPPPRPQKTHSRASSLDLNKLLQQGAPGVRGGWLPPPPALPPRPLASQVPLFLPPSEKTPVKKTLQTNFTRFREEEENQEAHRDGPLVDYPSPAPTQDLIGPSQLRVPQKPIRRKFHPDNPEALPPSTTSLAPPTKPLQKLQSKQKREIQMTIRKNKESNAVLTRLNSELQQQLKEVHQQRITLESQLHLLRPLNSGPN